jgi:uncharacterized protein YdaU (DUF1376 family)
MKMDYIARGFYRELLDEQWERGFLPNDIESLAEICVCPAKVMEKAWPSLSACFPENEEGQLVNPKMEAQRTDQDAKRAANSRSGALGGSKRLANAKRTQANAKQTLSERHIEEKRREEAEKSKEEETLASTALAVPATGKLICTLPLNQGEHEVFEEDVQTWKPLYPAVDVRQELRSIKGWCLGNPQKRKTKAGINRFIIAWLSKSQNDSKGAGIGTYKSKSESTLEALRLNQQDRRDRNPFGDVVCCEAGECEEAGVRPVYALPDAVRNDTHQNGDREIVIDAAR